MARRSADLFTADRVAPAATPTAAPFFAPSLPPAIPPTTAPRIPPRAAPPPPPPLLWAIASGTNIRRARTATPRNRDFVIAGSPFPPGFSIVLRAWKRIQAHDGIV